jgi:L-fuconolactonase
MKKIDTHLHFWKYQPEDYGWITEPLEKIKCDFLPFDLLPAFQETGFTHGIAVQARQCLAENDFLLNLCQEFRYLAGAVGWVDLQHPQVTADLERYADDPHFVGVRHIVQDEPDDQFMLRPAFEAGISRLADFQLTYDILVFERQLPSAIALARKFPRQVFVLDHIAKPKIGGKELNPWKENIAALAELPNVYCKISGMVTETHWGQWAYEDFLPYFDWVTEQFGIHRLMVGSDWPVALLSAAGYPQVMDIPARYFSHLSTDEQQAIYEANPKAAYRLKTLY